MSANTIKIIEGHIDALEKERDELHAELDSMLTGFRRVAKDLHREVKGKSIRGNYDLMLDAGRIENVIRDIYRTERFIVERRETLDFVMEV